MSAIRKNETMTFRVDSQTLDTIQRAARLNGKSVTSFVTEAAHVAAQRDLLDQRFFKVDAETFEEIEALLAEPAKIDEKLVELFRSERKWID
jgi:uncharacterized protein (DUF1778 family)